MDAAEAGLQALQVGARVGQAVGMVHPHPADQALLEPVPQQRVRQLEHLVPLRADAGQVVDVEEAPVVDAIGHAVGGQAPGLTLQQIVQRIEAARIAHMAVVGSQPCLQDGPRGRMVAQQGAQAGLELFLQAQAFGLVGRVAALPGGQAFETLPQGLPFPGRFWVQPGMGAAVHQQRQVARVDGEAVVIVGQHHRVAFGPPGQLELALLQHQAVLVFQHRLQHTPTVLGIAGLGPVDVEMVGVARGRPVFEHLAPQGIVGLQHAHVVGHDVHQQLQVMPVERGAEILEIGLGADLRVDLARVDHVVAMRAAGPGLQEGRGIHMADAQALEVGQQGLGLLEAQAGVQLQPVGGAGNDGQVGIPGGLVLGGGRMVRRPLVAQGLGQGGPAWIALQRSDIQRQLAPPVGVLRLAGARHIDLLHCAEHVFQLHGHHRGRRAAHVAVHGLGQARVRVGHAVRRFAQAFDQQVLLAQGLKQGHTFPPAAGDVAVTQLGIAVDTQLVAQAQVMAGPVGAQGGQVVGAHGGQRAARPALGRPETAFVPELFEIEGAVGQQAMALHRGGHLGGHDAQVLADDDAVVALAFQADQAQQFVERVGHVGALQRIGARHHPEQAHQAHHVVDAQGACMAHVGAQHIQHGLEPGFAQPLRRDGRKAPVLPVGVELVGRRAHLNTLGIQGGLGPGFRATRVHANGQVPVQADAHAQFAGQVLHRLELKFGLPLQVLEELDVGFVAAGEITHGLAAHIAVGLGPHRPAPQGRVLAVEVALQRVVQRLQAQVAAVHALELAEAPCAGRAPLKVLRPKARIQHLEHLELELRHPGVVHHGHIAQCLKAGAPGGRADQALAIVAFGVLVDVLHIQVEQVCPLPAGRAVGRGLLRGVREQRVQRVDADEIGALARGHLHQLAQVAEITHAPVGAAAHRVKLDRQAPHAGMRIERAGQFMRSGRAHHQRRGAHALAWLAGLQGQAVVAHRQAGRQLDRGRHQAGDIFAQQLSREGRRHLGRGGHGSALQALPVFERDEPGHRPAELFGTQSQRAGHRRGRGRHHHCRRQGFVFGPIAQRIE